MSLMDCEYLLIVCGIACCGVLAVDDFVASPHVTSSRVQLVQRFYSANGRQNKYMLISDNNVIYI